MSVLLRRKGKDLSRKPSTHPTLSRKTASDVGILSTQVQKVLKQLKRLDVEFSRFQLKSNGITKTNILRTSLLPFLRDPMCEFKHLMADEMVYLSLTSISTNTLIKWWKLLLACVLNVHTGSSVKPPIVTRDRNAYLEGISRIIARYEWNLVDSDTAHKFQLLLTQTLEFAIDKVQTLKILPLAMSAFVGKVFACCFFHLPKVSHALLFLLNVKQHLYEETIETFKSISLSIDRDSTQELQLLYSAFPTEVQYLANFGGMPGMAKSQKYYINSVPPPSHPVKGINNPNELWVRRWCSSDSDVFNSFFRHYIKFACDFIANNNCLSNKSSSNESLKGDFIDYNVAIYNSPGFSLLLAHILQVFDVSINRISLNNPNFSGLNVFFKEQLLSGKKGSNTLKGDSLLNINDIYFNSIVKVIKTCRDVKFLNHSASMALTGFIDKLFIQIAKNTSVYDYNRNGLITNIVYEFAIHVDNDIDWEFWLSSCYLMLSKTDHVQIILKSIAFLFNSWDLIPLAMPKSKSERSKASKSKRPCSSKCQCLTCQSYGWISNDKQTYKHNFALWLVSFQVWSQLFKHWEPIVRSYYVRLLIWKVLGMTEKYSSAERLHLELVISRNLEFSYDLVARKFVALGQHVSLEADRPLLHRTFVIATDNQNDEFEDAGKGDELRTTHPYEIFDEAVYSCLSLPLLSLSPEDDSDDADDKTVRSVSSTENTNAKGLVVSLGRIFRKLSTEDKKERGTSGLFAEVINSENSLAIATAATAQKSTVKDRGPSPASSLEEIHSGSSSPSLMSLTGKSYTDFSTASSVKSDVLSSTSSLSLANLLQPPELLSRPPEIVRPIYRFELAVEGPIDEGILLKQAKVQKKLDGLPRIPRLPDTTKLYNALFNETSESIVLDDVSLCLKEYQSFDEEELVLMPKVSHNPLFSEKTPCWETIGKSINEWNSVVYEFEVFIRAKVDDFKLKSTDNYEVYFKKIIPFLLVDSSNEFKLLNAG